MKQCTYPCDSQPQERTVMLPNSPGWPWASNHRAHAAPVPSPTQSALPAPYYFPLLHILNIQDLLPSGTLLPPPVAEIRAMAHS